MLLALSAVLIGLVLIVWSADRFLNGAVAVARLLNISPFLIGLTLVALGTSGPEIVVSIVAALNGTPEIAIGNVLGSNNANIGLVIGITALVTSLSFPQHVLKAELVYLLVATAVTVFCLADHNLSRLDGALLIMTLLIIGGYIALNKEKHATIIPAPPDNAKLSSKSGKKATWHFISGLVVLLISTQLLVEGASELARMLEVSELVIGLTIVAIGTSLPELAATLSGALKGQSSLAIGNIVGSNILNLLVVLAIAAVLSPTEIAPVAVNRDFLVVMAFTILLALFAYGFPSKPIVNRFEGFVLFSAWVAYNILIYIQTKQI